jgi:hypothetical protein
MSDYPSLQERQIWVQDYEVRRHCSQEESPYRIGRLTLWIVYDQWGLRIMTEMD